MGAIARRWSVERGSPGWAIFLLDSMKIQMGLLWVCILFHGTLLGIAFDWEPPSLKPLSLLGFLQRESKEHRNRGFGGLRGRTWFVSNKLE